MLRTRIIPVLLIKGRKCIKTRRFRKSTYLGDLKNIVRIFNDKEVDELIILDIQASRDRRGPDLDFLKEILVECFMPVCYGGGIRKSEEVGKLFFLGVEKVAINSHAFNNPEFIRQISDVYGSQSIVASVDVKKNFMGKYRCYTNGGQNRTGMEPAVFIRKMQDFGAGEILLNSIDTDGMMQGYDIELIKEISEKVEIPVIACGGAGKLSDFRDAVFDGGADAAAAGSFFVFQGVHRAVLISYPSRKEMEMLFRQETIQIGRKRVE